MPQNHVYHLFRLAQFTKKTAVKPDAGIKDGFDEMERKFLLEHPVWILKAVSVVYSSELSLHIYEH